MQSGLLSGGGIENNEVNSNLEDFDPETVTLEKNQSTDNNVKFMIPDFFLNNIEYGPFIVLLYVVIILIICKIQNLYIKFISLAITSMMISPSYGISMSVIFFSTTINPKNKQAAILYAILVLISLFHIFIPIFGANIRYSYGNYIFESIVFLLVLLVIWFMNRKKKISFQSDLNTEESSDISKIVSSNIQDNSSKSLYFQRV